MGVSSKSNSLEPMCANILAYHKIVVIIWPRPIGFGLFLPMRGFHKPERAHSLTLEEALFLFKTRCRKWKQMNALYPHTTAYWLKGIVTHANTT